MNRSETEAILYECRELMAQRISSCMATMISNMEDSLFKEATREKGTARAAQYFDAIRELKNRKYEIQTRFEKRFISLYEYNVQNTIGDITSSDITLSRIGHTSFTKNGQSSDSQAIKEAVKEVREDCRSVLFNIDKKMSSLLETVPAKRVDNPMQPEMVFEAFWESYRDIKIKPEIRVILVELFKKYVALELKYLYEDLNSYLADHHGLSTESGQQQE